MGASLVNVTCQQVYFSLTPTVHLSQSSSQPYYWAYYKHIENCSPTEIQSLISEILPIFLESFPNNENVNVLISEYFHAGNSIQTNLSVLRDKKTNEALAFSVYYFIEFYFLEGNYSKENRFFISTNVGVIRRKIRKSGAQKDFFRIKGLMDMFDYPSSNLLHFDVSIHPLSYYGLCQTSTCVFPSSTQKSTKMIENFIGKLFDIYDYTKCGENAYVVEDSFELEDKSLGLFLDRYNYLPEDLKLFVDMTGMKKGVGLGYVVLVYMVEGNTLGVSGGRYLVSGVPEVEVKEVVFQRPKL